MLTVTNLHKSYNEGSIRLHVLKGIDLRVNKGEIIAVMGVSGAGKSTLLNLLGGLDFPDQGSIVYEDYNITSLSKKQLSEFRNRNIGFVFQFHYLLPEFNVLENVTMPALIAKKYRKEEIIHNGKKLVEEVGLADRINHRPSELSGGECQRAAVARALMNQPEVILADEPSGNLDKKNSEIMHKLVLKLSREKQQTFIIATHNEHLASIANRILYLSEGTLQEKRI